MLVGTSNPPHSFNRLDARQLNGMRHCDARKRRPAAPARNREVRSG